MSRCTSSMLNPGSTVLQRAAAMLVRQRMLVALDTVRGAPCRHRRGQADMQSSTVPPVSKATTFMCSMPSSVGTRRRSSSNGWQHNRSHSDV
jgi:hypothetical protein